LHQTSADGKVVLGFKQYSLLSDTCIVETPRSLSAKNEVAHIILPNELRFLILEEGKVIPRLSAQEFVC